jgi:hypothetical protein
MLMHATYATKIASSVATTLIRIAPTKNPSSRLKMERHEAQWSLIRKGTLVIDASPHAGHRSLRHRSAASFSGKSLSLKTLYIAPPGTCRKAGNSLQTEVVRAYTGHPLMHRSSAVSARLHFILFPNCGCFWCFVLDPIPMPAFDLMRSRLGVQV